MATKRLTLLAAFVALLGVAVWTASAEAYSCTTQCYGNTCYTNCY